LVNPDHPLDSVFDIDDVADVDLAGWSLDRRPDYTLFHIQPTNLNAHFENHAGSKKFNIITTLEITDDNTDNNSSVIQHFDCGICYENIPCNLGVTYNCGHQFCSSCVGQYFTHMTLVKKPTCAFCRESIKHLNTKSLSTYNKIVDFCA
jgi:hypothetical protein